MLPLPRPGNEHVMHSRIVETTRSTNIRMGTCSQITCHHSLRSSHEQLARRHERKPASTEGSQAHEDGAQATLCERGLQWQAVTLQLKDGLSQRNSVSRCEILHGQLLGRTRISTSAIEDQSKHCPRHVGFICFDLHLFDQRF